MAIDCIIINQGAVQPWIDALPHARVLKVVTGDPHLLLRQAQQSAVTDWFFLLEPNHLAAPTTDAIDFLLDFDPEDFDADQVVRLVRGGGAICMHHTFPVVDSDGKSHEVEMATPLRDSAWAVEFIVRAELATHEFISDDLRAGRYDPASRWSADHYAWAAGRTVHALDRGCRFTLEPVVGGTGQIEYQDLVQYNDHELLSVFMLTTGRDYCKENWEQLKRLCPRAQLFRSASTIIGSLQALAERSSTEHFIVVDADNYVIDDSVFDFRPRDGQVFATHIWNAVNPLGVQSYGHGGIKVFPKFPFMTAAVTSHGNNQADVTLGTNGWIEVHELVASEHRFNTSFEATRATASKEIRKLAAKAHRDAESMARLRQWVEAAHNPAVLRAIQDQA